MYYSKTKGERQVKNHEYRGVSLGARLSAAVNMGMNIWLRIAIALNAVALLVHVFEKWRALRNGREDETED